MVVKCRGRNLRGTRERERDARDVGAPLKTSFLLFVIFHFPNSTEPPLTPLFFYPPFKMPLTQLQLQGTKATQTSL